MAAELIAGLSIFKSLLDSAKGLKDINDAAVRNGAIVELQEKILAAQTQQTVLVERIRELEAEMARLEAWDREKERYQLTDHGGGTFTYALKAGMQVGEPFHRICVHCYQQRRNLSSSRTAGWQLGERKLPAMLVGVPSCSGFLNPGRPALGTIGTPFPAGSLSLSRCHHLPARFRQV